MKRLLIVLLFASPAMAGTYTTDSYGTYGTTDDGRRVTLYTDSYGTYGQVGNDSVRMYHDSYGSYGQIGNERVVIWNDNQYGRERDLETAVELHGNDKKTSDVEIR